MVVIELLNAVVPLLKADATLVELLGGQHIYRNRSRATIQNPSVTYSVLWNGVLENNSPVTIQFDIWGKTYESCLRVEQRLYELLHSDVATELGGMRMWSFFDGSFDFHEEDQSDYHRGAVYKFIPARENG